MTKYFRPFWFFNVEKIETWLSYMAGKGQHLVKLNFFPGTFAFKSGKPRDTVLRIGYGEQNPAMKRSSDWEEIFRHKNVYAMASTIPAEQIKISPPRDGLVDGILHLLNRITLGYYMVLTLIPVGGATFIFLLASRVITLTMSDSSSIWWFKYGGLTAWSIALALCGLHILLTRTSHKLLHKDEWLLDLEPHCQDLIKKRKIGWFRAPDKLERWLEEMELQGRQLRRVSKFGLSFSFARGEARKVRYCVDYQLMANRSYFASHRETGWNLLFASRGSFAVWTIWAKPFENQTPQPLYTDEKHMLRHALLVMTSQTMAVIPLLLLYAANIRATIENPKLIGVSILYGLALLIFTALIIQVLLYYLRLKKRAAACN